MTDRSDHAVGRLAAPFTLAQAATIVDLRLRRGAPPPSSHSPSRCWTPAAT